MKPDNILFSGERFWLVDWEAALLNDRFCDLAVMANDVVADDTHEAAYLEAYFGEPAGACRTARFYLMRQVCVCFTPWLTCRMHSEVPEMPA